MDIKHCTDVIKHTDRHHAMYILTITNTAIKENAHITKKNTIQNRHTNISHLGIVLIFH